MPELATVIDPHRDRLIDLNTWGDAIVTVSDDPVGIARLALDIRDYFRKTNFEAKGMPQILQSRISLHAGTVKHGYDPIRRCDGVIGSNLNLAARIEPIIVPGEVWSTGDFAQMLQPHTAAERLAFDELGERDLAKNYGSLSLLRLRRSEEASDLSSVAKASSTAAIIANSIFTLDAKLTVSWVMLAIGINLVGFGIHCGSTIDTAGPLCGGEILQVSVNEICLFPFANGGFCCRVQTAIGFWRKVARFDVGKVGCDCFPECVECFFCKRFHAKGLGIGAATQNAP